MYNNIGKKIKILAKVFFWIGIAGSVISGIVLMIQGKYEYAVYDYYYGGYYNESSYDAVFILYGLLVMIVGSLLSWLSGFFIYGFGELVDKTCDIQAAVCDGKSNVTDTANREKRLKLDRMLKQGLITQEEYDKVMGEN